MSDKFFLDTNVCIYAFDRDSKKKEKALDLIVSNQATVSTQVLMETANVPARSNLQFVRHYMGYGLQIRTSGHFIENMRIINPFEL